MNRGLFIGDMGYHLYEADQAFHLYGSPDTFFWLSSYLNGAWMSLSPTGLSCYWAVLGGSLLAATVSVVSAHLVMLLFRVRASTAFSLAMVSAVLQLHFLYDFLIHYYTLPFLAAEIMLLCYFHARKPSESRRNLWLILSALAAASLYALRLSAVHLAAIPLLYEAAWGLIHRKFAWKTIIAYSLYLLGFLALFFILFCWWKSCFPEYRYSDVSRAHIGHPIKGLLKMHFMLLFDLSLPALAVAVLLVLARFAYKLRDTVRNTVIALFSCAVLVPILYVGYIAWQGFPDPTGKRWFYFYFSSSILLCLVLAFIAVLPGWPTKKSHPSLLSRGREMNYRLAILMISAMVLFYPLGTDTGLIKVLYGLPIVIPALLVTLRRHLEYTKVLYRAIVGIWIIGALCILPFNTDTHSRHILNRFQCNTAYSIPTMAGMYETPQRVKAQENAIAAIQAYTDKDEEILFLSYLYELLVFSERKSWMHPLFHISRYEDSNFIAYAKHKGMPRVAVMTTDTPSMESWQKNLLEPHYELVYSGDCTMEDSHDAKSSKTLSIWLLKSCESENPCNKATALAEGIR